MENKILAQISLSVPETAHWHALISKAEFLAHRVLPQGIEDYLIRLFMRFEREASAIEAENISPDTTKMNLKLRSLGDQCLLLCGFYPESSQEYGVALEEFISMGKEAYQKLASSESGEEAMTFEYLATHFKQISELLCFIHGFTGQQVKTVSHVPGMGHEEFSTSVSRVEHPSFSSPITHRVLN